MSRWKMDHVAFLAVRYGLACSNHNDQVPVNFQAEHWQYDFALCRTLVPGNWQNKAGADESQDGTLFPHSRFATRGPDDEQDVTREC